jgi:hypothetical protein
LDGVAISSWRGESSTAVAAHDLPRSDFPKSTG